MVEKKKKKWSHILIRWLRSAGACVGGATRLHHPVRALKAAYFRIRRQIFLVSIERNQNSLLMLNGLKEASKKTQ